MSSARAVQRALGVRRKKWWVGFWEDDCRGPEESEGFAEGVALGLALVR